MGGVFYHAEYQQIRRFLIIILPKILIIVLYPYESLYIFPLHQHPYSLAIYRHWFLSVVRRGALWANERTIERNGSQKCTEQYETRRAVARSFQCRFLELF